MYYNSSTGQNQSEKKGFVTSSFCPSCCNVTLEKIDQEMYFWSRLSIIPSLWPSKVASLQLFEIERIFRFLAPPQVVVICHLHSPMDFAPSSSSFHLSTMASLSLPVRADKESLIFPFTIGRSFLVLLKLVVPHGIQSMHRSWFMNSPSVDAFPLLILLQHATTTVN